MLDAARSVVAFVAAQHNHRGKAESVRALCEFEAILERVFRRQDRDDAGTVRLGAKIDRDMPQVGLFAPADCAIGHEHKPPERRYLAHQTIAIDPRINTLLERKIHPRRAHFDVEKKPLGIAQGF